MHLGNPIPRGRRPRCRRAHPAAAFAAAVAATGLVGPVAAATAATPATACREVQVPIRVGPQAGVLAGTLCVPPHARTVQILVPGNTYNRSYWQATVRPATYSYVRQANLAGYATLAIDRLGTGASLHPPSAHMTFTNDVATVHHVVTAVRSGTLGSFTRVVGVGHSLGSIVVNQLAGTHTGDLDALVLTGFSHSINFANALARVATRYALPAGDASFAGQRLDPYYLTAQPRGRTAFYSPAAEPEILAHDDRTRDKANLVEMAGFADFQIPNLSRTITSPVLLLNGTADAVACGVASGDCATSRRLQDAEQPWFGPGAEVTARAVPGLGHAVTMHRSAATVNRGITAWIDDNVGSGAGVRGGAPGVIPATAPSPPSYHDPAAGAVNQGLLAVTPSVADTYTVAAEGIPGLGDGANPVPAYNEVLRTVADAGRPVRFLR
jgi:pimeloyl-ACP methyl ester carboxylesterase